VRASSKLAPREEPRRLFFDSGGPVSQNSAARSMHVEVDVDLGETGHRTALERAIDEPAATGVIAPGSLERR